MRVSEARFRKILREESRKILREQSYPSQADFMQMLPKPLALGQQVKQIASEVVTTVREIPPSVYVGIATAVGLWLGRKAVKSAAGSAATNVAAGAVGATSAELGWGAAASNALAGGVAAAETGGAVAATGAVASALAPAVIMAVGTFMVGWAVDEAINAKIEEAAAKDRNTPTAIRNAMMGVYNAAVAKGKQQKLWTSQELRSSFATEAMRNLTYGRPNNQNQTTAISLILSLASDDDINREFDYAAASEKVDVSMINDAKNAFKKAITGMQTKIQQISSRMQSDVKKIGKS